MRQLFIVSVAATIAAASASAYDLTQVGAGSLGIAELGGDKYLAAAPTKDFAIAYGRPNSQAVVVAVNKDTLTVTKQTKQAGTKFKASVTIPTPVIGKNYTIDLVKMGTEKHERYEYTATTCAKDGDTANSIAAYLVTELNAKMENTKYGISASASTGTITVTATDYEGWNLVAADDLVGATVTITTRGQYPTCDAAYVKNLASMCAQNRGFENTYQDGASIYPGYPMTVDSDDYKIYNLRFKNPRDYGRTRDEAVWQEVIIAVPTANEDFITALDKILV